MALQRQEDRRRQQAKQNAYEFSSKKSPTESFSNDSLERRSNSPARSDETARSASPAVVAPPRPARKRRPAPKPPVPLPAANPGKSQLIIIYIIIDFFIFHQQIVVFFFFYRQNY